MKRQKCLLSSHGKDVELMHSARKRPREQDQLIKAGGEVKRGVKPDKNEKEARGVYVSGVGGS